METDARVAFAIAAIWFPLVSELRPRREPTQEGPRAGVDSARRYDPSQAAIGASCSALRCFSHSEGGRTLRHHRLITNQIVSAIEQGAGEFKLSGHRSAGNIMRPVNVASKTPTAT
jgi:hypothetical protein